MTEKNIIQKFNVEEGMKTINCYVFCLSIIYYWYLFYITDSSMLSIKENRKDIKINEPYLATETIIIQDEAMLTSSRTMSASALYFNNVSDRQLDTFLVMGDLKQVLFVQKEQLL